MSMKNNSYSNKVFLIACQLGKEEGMGPELAFSQNRFTSMSIGSDNILRCQVRKHILEQFSINQNSGVSSCFYRYNLWETVSQLKGCKKTSHYLLMLGIVFEKRWFIFLGFWDLFSNYLEKWNGLIWIRKWCQWSSFPYCNLLFLM